MLKVTDTLAINDLHWWTNADHLVEVAARAGVRLKRADVLFAEHKVNGKTKGSIILRCHSFEDASKVFEWLMNHDFQGKKLSPTYVTSNATLPLKATGLPLSGPRPILGTQALLAHGPTNAHGGINFNRVRPNARAVQQHLANVGLGWPSAFGGQKVNTGPGKLDRQGFLGYETQDQERGVKLQCGHTLPYSQAPFARMNARVQDGMLPRMIHHDYPDSYGH